MKVLHFYRTYFPDTQGGLEEAIRQICRSTSSHGIESRVLTLSPAPTPRILNFSEGEVWRAKLDADIASCSMGVGAFRLYRQLERWADIVHFHFPWPFADVVQLSVGRKCKPRLMTYHSDIVRQRWLGMAYGPLMRRFVGGMDRIVATSPQYALTSHVLQRFSGSTEVIPIGLDESMYPAADPDLVEKVVSIYGRRFMLFVGVLREYKGLRTLVDAMRGTDFPLVIAGKGPMEGELREEVSRRRLSNVHFAGYVSDELKMALLRACTAVVLPSHLRSEAFGVSLVEGAMMGKPLISTELGTGTSYVNVHGETGLVCAPGDSAALREALLTLEGDQTMAMRMGCAARIRFEQLFTAEIMGGKYFEVYSDIISANR